MADSNQSTGRARGRARGKPMTEEEARASLRKPGEYPAHIQPPPQPSASGAPGPGRGRGTSGDRGRGVSVERGEAPAKGAGRAFHRGSITAPGQFAGMLYVFTSCLLKDLPSVLPVLPRTSPAKCLA